MMTQKDDLYQTYFSTSSGVRPVSLILSQLNVLFTGLVKQYYTKNNDSHVIHR